MQTDPMEAVAQKLADIRNVILDREGEDVQDQFEVSSYIIIVNIEGSGYVDDEDVFTLIQIERGPVGMEEFIACAVINEEDDSFILTNESDDILSQLDEVYTCVYRHWHWLDLPNALTGSVALEDEDDFEDENF